MSELENIEKLVQKYKPRIEEIFGMKIGSVSIKEYNTIPHPMAVMSGTFREVDGPISTHHATDSTLLTNLELLNMVEKETRKRFVVHELAHILDWNNKLRAAIKGSRIERYVIEGFAEYVSLEFPEIYQDEIVTERIKRVYEEQEDAFKKYGLKEQERFGPYIKGYEFFKAVEEKIGRENILKVFQNPPQTIEEILEPGKYLERIGEK